MTNPAIPDGLERLLREDGRRAIPDDGFSRRVSGKLGPRRRFNAWLRPALLLGAAAVGGVLAWLLAPGTSLAQGFLDLARLQSQTPSAAAALAMALAMAVVAAVVAAEES